MAEERDRVVIDTNLFLSSLMAPKGPAASAVAAAFETHEVVQSPETLGELKEKLGSKKLAAFIDPDLAHLAFQAISHSVTVVEAAHNVDACRDPKDNKFLDLAVEARALTIVSGDKDLRELKHINGIGYVIPIIPPQQYLNDVTGKPLKPEERPTISEFSTLLASMRTPKHS